MTEVRNAKANELNAQAELLKAKAGAETILANAQAGLLNAQAKVEEAKAKKLAAETQLLEVEADLRAVEVELQKVQVEAAKVELEKKKVELQALQKQLEVTIAECDLQLAEIAGELEALEMQLQIEKVEQQLALLEAEDALADYLDGKDAEEQEDFQAAIAMYFHLQEAILEAQIQINEWEIQIAQLEAAEDANYDQLIEDYQEATNELARIQVLIDKANEYLEYEGDDLLDELAYVNAALIDANNDLADSLAAYQSVYKEWQNLRRDFRGHTEAAAPYFLKYRYSEFLFSGTAYDEEMNDYDVFDALQNIGAYWSDELVDEENDDWAYQLGYDNEDGEFVPFFTEEYENGPFAYYFPEDEQDEQELDEKGINYTPALGTWRYHYVPAEFDVEAVSAFIDAKLAEALEDIEAQKEAADALAEETAEEIQDQLDALEPLITEREAYMEAVAPKFEAAEEAYEEAGIAEAATALVEQLAQIAVNIASIDDHEVEEALAIYQDAINATTAAYEAYYGNGEIDGAYTDSLNAAAELEALQTGFIAYYGGTDKKDAEYKRDNAIAIATSDVTAANKAVSDLKAAYDAAKKAYEAADKKVKDAEAAVAGKLDVLHAAEIADNTASTEATQKALADAQTAYDNAVTALNTAKDELAVAKVKYDGQGNGSDEAPYIAAQNNATAAQGVLDDLNEDKEEWADAIAEAEEAYEEAKLAAEEAWAAMDAAEAAEDAAYEAFDAAYDALAAEEKADYAEAWDAYQAAQDEVVAAQNTLDSLYNIYHHYPVYLADLDEEDETSLASQYAALAEQLETLPAAYDGVNEEPYADFIADLEEEAAEFEEDAEALKAIIAKYEEQYRPAYVEGIEAFNEIDPLKVEAYFAYLTAQAYVDMLNEYKDMLVNVTFYDEEGNLVSVEDYIANLEAQYKLIEDAINAEIEAYMYDYDNIYEINRLELKIEQLEACIEIWTAELEKWEAVVNEYMSGE